MNLERVHIQGMQGGEIACLKVQMIQRKRQK
jgi:hypothetical protein